MLAVIVSKLVISIALAVGVAALGGVVEADQQGQGVGEFAAQGLGKLVVGTAILCMAAFSPFIVLRLIRSPRQQSLRTGSHGLRSTLRARP